MSNPSIATKLLTLVKGVFGRKEPVSTVVPAKQNENTSEPSAKESTIKTEESPAKTAGTDREHKDKAAESTDEPSAKESAAEAGESPSNDEQSAKTPEEPAAAAATESAEAPQDSGKEASLPATEDIPEKGKQIAEEIAVAEANTEVASDDVLERVRKDAAPSADDLAVPTYDDLTLPSIRARLRKLTIGQVRDLRAYEVAHQSRPEFIKMYDNRINKLENEAE